MRASRYPRIAWSLVGVEVAYTCAFTSDHLLLRTRFLHHMQILADFLVLQLATLRIINPSSLRTWDGFLIRFLDGSSPSVVVLERVLEVMDH